jgi:hypothetical protein
VHAFRLESRSRIGVWLTAWQVEEAAIATA